MVTATPVQILDDSLYISHSVDSPNKGRYSTIPPPAMGNLAEQRGLDNIGVATSLGEG